MCLNTLVVAVKCITNSTRPSWKYSKRSEFTSFEQSFCLLSGNPQLRHPLYNAFIHNVFASYCPCPSKIRPLFHHWFPPCDVFFLCFEGTPRTAGTHDLSRGFPLVVIILMSLSQILSFHFLPSETSFYPHICG